MLVLLVLLVPLALLARPLLQATPVEGGPWTRHAIDPGTATLRGADGVRLGDADGDGDLDVVTGWEEGRAVRIAFQPERERVRQPWPTVTVGEVADAEDAVFADLDGDGRLDVVSCSEGATRTVHVHWCPADVRDAQSWKTLTFPATAGEQAWMFALPFDVDGERGMDLLVGSKGAGGAVGWLRSPPHPRDLGAWTYHRIVDAGWIMSLCADGAGVVVSDRRGANRGVYRLEPERRGDAVDWKRSDLGGAHHEVMFLDPGPPVTVATRDSVLLVLAESGAPTLRVANPFAVPHGKAVARGDLDLDGKLDLVVTTNTASDRSKPGVGWLKETESGWRAHDISGTQGAKFDRVELLDLDGDGDLDVLTCEERDNLGVLWYENPTR